MFYFLYLTFFKEGTIFSVLRIFRFITVRAFISLFIAFIISLIIGPYIIDYLRKYKISQMIRKDYGYPESHQLKLGTPTMGGLIILISTIISILLCANLKNLFILWGLIVLVGFGIIGFIDDYLKLTKKNPEGLKARYKLLLQIYVSLLIGIIIYVYKVYVAKLWDIGFNPSELDYKNFVSTIYTTYISIPFFKNLLINLNYFYIVFVVFVITGSSNAVNLTDGLDGLAAGTVALTAVSFAVLSYLAGNWKIASYLNILFIQGAAEMTVYCAAIIGAMLGFLWFNSYPASVFMGDTGSLAIGAAIGYTAIVIKKELLLIFAGGIFVIEALSVMLQVFSFKLYKKRIFLMAPIHHHYEKMGLKEPKIILRFWIVSIILTLITLATVKFQ
ncbi:MAG TPA: phospho-N-acetylmuramoyl-pentapeptide-transferase [bacterium]|nr:phospho-N-acetylmuramoyl-pentapeptide-transferase [bacterium]HOL46571.1 phospho-N-acetylmuramoyl-pentapeptide-transferase [bacterium]HPQ17858.1 phospho-N-acetylmuramoyl-pentapeptide-transferase [bacterium]